jgi:hypothetical protein
MAAKYGINRFANSTNEDIYSLYYIKPNDIPFREIKGTRGPEA